MSTTAAVYLHNIIFCESISPIYYNAGGYQTKAVCIHYIRYLHYTELSISRKKKIRGLFY